MKIKLRKCAYIFHHTNNVYSYGTKEQIKTKHTINKFFKEFYDNDEKTETILECDSLNPNYYTMFIETANTNTHLNDIQIAWIDEPDNIINHRKHIDTSKFKNKYFHQWTVSTFYSNKFSTLEFEFYTGLDDLGYIRVHFKHNYYCFVVDKRDNCLYTSGENGHHKPISRQYIKEYLNITSKAATKEFDSMIDSIQNYKD